MNDEVIRGECGEVFFVDECEFAPGCPGCGAGEERLFACDDTN